VLRSRQVLEDLGDLTVSRICVQQALIPLPRGAEFPVHLGDFAKCAECNEVFRVEFERGGENVARFERLPGLIQGLTEDDMPAHVARLPADARDIRRWPAPYPQPCEARSQKARNTGAGSPETLT
jgi:hypothetical protein